MKAVRSVTVRPLLPEAVSGLETLAANLRWSWHRPTRDLFEEIDPEEWARGGHDPRMLLARARPERLAELAADEAYVARVATVVEDLREATEGPSWFAEHVVDPGGVIAYFSPEFGIAEAVPQYSGGLGILAGDHLKSASDLGVPLVGVGLFYRHGYFRQLLSPDGWQQERFPDLDPYAMSMELCEGVRIHLDLADDHAVAQVWRAQVGRTPLYLLDTDIEENPDHVRVICDRLYGGDTEHRLRQEVLLGIGGVRMLRELGVDGAVFHTNEGHAGFLGLERIRLLMAEAGLSFDEALLATRAGGVFTTHTPVPAGIDRFPLDLIARYFGAWAAEVGIGLDRLIEIGHRPGEDPEERFNMAVMGMRLAERRNGVAALHGEVSRAMFADLWPGVPVPEVPVGSITNGVHPATWVSPEMADLLTSVNGPAWGVGTDDEWRLDGVDDDRLWAAHLEGKRRLVGFARQHLRETSLARGLSPSELEWTAEVLDPDALTICFARRFATYKRATLLLSQLDRLRALIADPERPVQFLFAGKAHPADEPGKELIRAIAQFAQDREVRHRFLFLDDYDMSVSRFLLHGADVWLNNPLRPQEACGTSGMKAAMNGAINCSVLDGWWDECFTPESGWAISSSTDPDLEQRNRREADSLFELLEHQVVPRYYEHRPPGGVSPAWAETMRGSIALGAFVSSGRMVRDYVDELYVPAAAAAAALARDRYAGARDLAAWRDRVLDAWHHVHVDEVDFDESIADLGSKRTVNARISLGDLHPNDVQVQLLSGIVGQAGELEQATVTTMSPVATDGDRHLRFEAELAFPVAGRAGVTVRVVPSHPLLGDPLDVGRVAWAG